MKRRVLLAVMTGSLLLGLSMGAAAEEAVTEEALEAATESVVEEQTEAEYEIVELGDRPAYKALDYVTLGQYKDLPVEITPIDITDEQVDSAVRSALIETITEGTVQNGDIANIDFVGKKDGVPFENGSAQGTDLTIGSGQFIPGFEEGLIDQEIGSTVDLNLTFPEDYHDEKLAGADTVFTVTINSVRRYAEPSDDAVNRVTGGTYSTLDGYRQYHRDLLTAQAEEQQLYSINNELMTQLFNTCKVNEYPEDLVKYGEQEIWNSYIEQAQMYGVDMETLLQAMFASMGGMDIATFEAMVPEAVKENLTQELILSAIAEQENLAEITDEEYQTECQNYFDRVGASLNVASVEEFVEQFGREMIEANIRMDRALTFVRENAAITEKEPETEGISEMAGEPVEEVTEAVTE